MEIIEIEVRNIFSYYANTIIPFSKNISLIVGPNNSGKTNIIRLLDLFLKELASPDGNFLESYSYKNEDSTLRIRIVFCDCEIDAIIGFFYLQSACIFNSHPLKNKEKLRYYFNEVDIEIKWKIIVLSLKVRNSII